MHEFPIYFTAMSFLWVFTHLNYKFKAGGNLKKAICLLCALSLLFGIIGCKKEQVIVVGVNLELTGRQAQYGNACLRGIQLAEEEINKNGGIGGKKIKLTVLDNRSTNSEAALIGQRLEHLEKAVAMLGPSMSGGVKATLGSGVKIPLITPTATADDLRRSGATNVYRLCFTDSEQGKAMGQYANELGFEKVGLLLNLASDYSINSGKNFAESFKKGGGTIVATEYYKAGDMDYNAVLTKMQRLNLDAIYFPGYYTEGGLIIKQARQLGMDCAFLSGDAFDSPELGDIAGDRENLTGVYFTNHYYPNDTTLLDFQEKYFKTYNEYPTAYACLGYDSAKILFEALKNCKGDYSKIFESLDNIKDYQGVTGTFTIKKNRDAKKEVLLNKIINGERTGQRLGEGKGNP